MSSRSLGTLTYDLIAKIGGFVQGMTEAERVADRKTREMERKAKARAKAIEVAWGKTAKLITAGFAGITAGGVFLKVINETRQAEQEQAQLAAVLQSTGQAAGFSKDRLNEMAEAMSAASLVSSGEINQAQTTLLAFTGIVGGEFTRALQSAIDMAQRTGMSVVSAAETVGRALDVPSKGLTSLSKQGFRFTEEQKKLAEQLENAGKTAEAQAIILQALEESYGGAAQAARNTFGGAITALQNQLNSLLTGSDGSLDDAKDAVNELTDALGGYDAKQAFESITSWVAGLASALADMVVQFGLGIRYSDGLLDALRKYGLANPFKSHAEHVASIRSDIESLRKSGTDPALLAQVGGEAGRQAAIRDAELRLQYHEAMADREQARADRELFGSYRGVPETGSSVPELTSIPVTPSGGGAKPKKSGSSVDEGQRFIQQMRERIALIGLETEQEKLLAKAVLGTIKFKSDADRVEAVRLAGQYDTAKAAYEQKKAIEELTVSYGRLLDEQERNYQAQLDAMGLGEKNRQYLAAQLQIQEDFRRRQETLDDALRRGDISRERYEIELRMMEEAQGRSLGILDNYNKQKLQKETDWLLGAKEALVNYGDQAKNVYESVGDAVMNAFQGMENALVQFVTKGKMDFASLADSIIANMARIAIQQSITGPLAGAIGNLFSGGAAPAGVTPGLDWSHAAGDFSSGGYTGDGGKFDVAGLVHRGEGVLNQDDMAQLGGRDGFERFRRALHGYANGGVVGMPSTAVPAVAQQGGGAVPVTINFHGATERPEKVDGSMGPQGLTLDLLYQKFARQLGRDTEAGTSPLNQPLERRYGLRKAF